jgi:uncharacterized membrane protein (DUF106 family)
MAFETLLNPILNPLLGMLGYFWTLLILVFVITLIITLIYKYTTNQNLMKDLKDELKSFQKQVKELKDKPDEAMKVQKKMMETNSKYMMHSFKPMIFTFLPIIIFFGWMSAHLAYYPILPSEEFSVTMNFNDGVTGNVELILSDSLSNLNGLNQTIKANQATWFLKGEVGEYLLEYKFNNQIYNNEVVISNAKDYKEPISKIKNNGIINIIINLEKVKPIEKIPLIGSIPWIGGFGWLGTYIILSLIFSSLLRKMMKIY